MKQLDLYQEKNIDVTATAGAASVEATQSYPTVIVRENVIDGVNTLSQSLLKDAHVKYVIKFDFDLANQHVTIPENCILEVDGGSLSNGGLIGNNTIYVNRNEVGDALQDIVRTGTWNTPHAGVFADKPSADVIDIGYRYFCTDRQTTEGGQDGIDIIHKGLGVWVDALGRTVV